MYLIEVIPLIKIPYPGAQTFQYFSSKELKKGSLISIPIGKTKAQGIVFDCLDLLQKKLEIKKSSIALKSIKEVISFEPIVNENQIKLAQFISDKYLEPLGLCLKSFIPPNILKRKKLPLNIFPKENIKNQKKVKPVLLLKKNRIKEYIKLIKETLDKNQTVLFLSPEILKAAVFLKDLKKISLKTAFYHAELKNSQKLKIWQDVCQNNAHILLGTRSSIGLPFFNLGLIIIDEEESSSFKSWDQHPKLNARDVVIKLAELHGAKIILGTNFLTANSYCRIKNNEFESIGNLDKSNPRIDIVDMQKERKWGNFSLFSETLKKELRKNIESKKQILLFVNRKGLSTSIICKNCGYVEKCPNCDSPMVYHKQKDKGMLICHYCLYSKNPPAYCPSCKSTKIRYTGVGIDKVNQEIENFLKFNNLNAKIAILHKELPEEKQKRIIDDFKKKKIDVLLTTQVAFKYPNLKSGLSAAILPDFLLNIPDFSANEKAFRVFNLLKNISKKTTIQTFKPDLSIFKYLKDNDFEGFIKEELEQRKIFSYPPFSEIIKLTFRNKLYKVCLIRTKELEKQLLNIYSQKEILGPSSAFIAKIKGRYIFNIVIKSNNLEKKDRLKGIVPSFWEIEVDPESII